MAATRLITVLSLCVVLALGAFPTKTLAGLAAASAACGAVLAPDGVDCVSADKCGVASSVPGLATSELRFVYPRPPGSVAESAGTNVGNAGGDFGACCALCQAQPTCGGFQLLFFPTNPPFAFGCYLLTADDCNNVTVTLAAGEFDVLLGAQFGRSAFVCPTNVTQVATPTCASGLGFTAGADCTATLTAADLYGGDIDQLPSGVSLTLMIDNEVVSGPSATVETGGHSFSLSAASAGKITSDSCQGNFSVAPRPVNSPPCKRPATFVAAASSCAVDPPPTAEELLLGPLDPSSPSLAVTITGESPVTTNPTSLLVDLPYSYSLTASKCGVTLAPCNGTITVQAAEVPTPSCMRNATFAAESGCARRPPTPSELLEGALVPPTASVTLTITGGTPLATNPSTLLVGSQYSYSLTASNCGQTSAACTGTIIVEDREAIDANLILCPPLGATIAPSAADAVFTTTYNGGGFKRNGCPVTVTIPTGPGGSAVTCDRCNKQGRHEFPSCSATVSGKTLTVTGSGGNGNYLTWPVNAADASGASSSVTKACGVCVQNNKGVCSTSWVAGTTTPGC